MSDEIRINGNIYSWGSIVCKVASERFHGFDQIGFGDKLERSKQYGMGKHHAPRGRTRGKYSTDPVKLRGPTSTVQALREKLASLATDGVSYGDVEFEIVVQYVESNETPLTVEIQRVKFASQTSSHEESPDPMKEEVELDCMFIKRNGLTLFDSSEGAP